MRLLMALGLAGLLFAACGDNPDEGARTEVSGPTAGAENSSIAPTTPAPGADRSEPSPAESTATTGDTAAIPNSDSRAGMAIADLAQLLGIDHELIGVIAVETVTWRDGSIGCPEPGMSYTQALVPGTRIILEHAGTEYHYHATDRVDPFYCATPTEPSRGTATDS